MQIETSKKCFLKNRRLSIIKCHLSYFISFSFNVNATRHTFFTDLADCRHHWKWLDCVWNRQKLTECNVWNAYQSASIGYLMKVRLSLSFIFTKKLKYILQDDDFVSMRQRKYNHSFCQRFISLTFLGCVCRLVPSDDDTLRQFRIPIYSSNRFYITIDLFSHHLNWECFIGSYGSLLYNIDACFALVFSVFFPAVSSQNLICIFSVCKKKQIHETNLSISSAMVRAIIRRTKIESKLNKAQGASNSE